MGAMSAQSKLFEWQRANAALRAAREQLNTAARKPTPEAVLEPLRRRVRDLEDQCTTLLCEIEALRTARGDHLGNGEPS
jgi:hypothetical protein